MKNKGKIIGIIIMLILIVVFLIGGFVFYKNSDAVRVRKQLDLGEKYLAELDYDQAIVAYETVIEIEPMNVEAYLGLADAYIGKDDYESALTVLQKGYNLTADDEIKAKIDEINEEIERVEAEKARLEEEERKRLEQVSEPQFNIDLEEIEWIHEWLEWLETHRAAPYHLTDEQTREAFCPLIEQIELYLNENSDCVVACEALAELYYRINELDKCLYYRELAYNLTGNESDNPKETIIDGTTYNEYGKVTKGADCVYKYEENKVIEGDFFDSKGNLVLVSEYFYLSGGRIDYVSYIWIRNGSEEKYIYTYEGNNMAIDIVTTDGKTKPFCQVMYDELDRILEYVRYDSDGKGEIEYQSKTEFDDEKHEIVDVTGE